MRKKRFDAANVKVHDLILLNNKEIDLHWYIYIILFL